MVKKKNAIATKIRNALGEGESLSINTTVRKMFLGNLIGIILFEGANNHVQFEILLEDDGLWSPACKIIDSAWLEDYKNVLIHANRWCERNCEPDMFNGYRIGWNFR